MRPNSTIDIDPYKILGIAQDADEEAIKKAFREKAKELHPDVTTDEAEKKKLEEQFKKLNAAYTILSDKEKRAAYDNPTAFGGGMDFNDIINHIFSRNMGMGEMPGGFFHFGDMGNPNVVFQRTLQRSFDIDVFTLMLGGEVMVQFSDGKGKKISIPPNTPANARFQLNVDKNTTFVLTPNVIIPKLTEEKLKKLKEVMSS